MIPNCLTNPILAFPVEVFDVPFSFEDRDAGGREVVCLGNDVGFV